MARSAADLRGVRCSCRNHERPWHSAAVTTSAGIVALALAGPASATVDDLPMAVKNCETTGQVCAKTTLAVAITHGAPMMVEFTASPEHCSDIIAHIIVDGAEWGSNRVGPGQSDGGYEFRWTPGPTEYWCGQKAYLAAATPADWRRGRAASGWRPTSRRLAEPLRPRAPSGSAPCRCPWPRRPRRPAPAGAPRPPHGPLSARRRPSSPPRRARYPTGDPSPRDPR